jgi:hypothetical protein
MSDDNVACSFCGRDRYNAIQIIKGYDGSVCRDCLLEGIRLLTGTEPKRHSGSAAKKTYLASDFVLTCSICRRKITEVRAATSINHSKDRICDECLMICFDIMMRVVFGERKPSHETYTFLINKSPKPPGRS